MSRNFRNLKAFIIFMKYVKRKKSNLSCTGTYSYTYAYELDGSWTLAELFIKNIAVF